MVMMIDFTQEIAQIFKFRKKKGYESGYGMLITQHYGSLMCFTWTRKFKFTLELLRAGEKKNPPKPSKPVCIAKIIVSDFGAQ